MKLFEFSQVKSKTKLKFRQGTISMSNTQRHFRIVLKHAFLFVLGATLIVAPRAIASAQKRRPPQTSGAAQQPATRIRWSGEQGVTRYRLQLASDAEFTDIVFDRAVVGREYVVRDLPPGNYFWRVAPAASETGSYSTPAPVQITNAPGFEGMSNTRPPIIGRTPTITPPVERILQPPANVGWRTATGNVSQPLAAHLRDASGYDLVGVNADGNVYALNGATGVALWTTRFRPRARRGEATGNSGAAAFAPIIVSSAQKPLANLVVAYEGGVRSLDGATGRELWRAPISGRAASGTSFDLDGDGAPEIAIVDDSTSSLVVLNGETGSLLSQTKLAANAVGAPAALNTGAERSLALALSNGVVEVRNMSGKSLRTIKLDASITTAPLVVQMANASILMIGTDKGLIALNGTDLRPLWRVATDKADAPRGTLAAADLDGDGVPEALMITRSGRVVAINVGTGKIKWYAGGATDAASAAFADLNGDNALDVIIAAGPSFAIGLSGRDGSLIWRADETGQARQQGSSDAGAPRVLVAAPVNANSSFVVGSDPAHVGLRAVGLPHGAAVAVNR